jgi:hypothetical protein
VQVVGSRHPHNTVKAVFKALSEVREIFLSLLCFWDFNSSNPKVFLVCILTLGAVHNLINENFREPCY